MQMTVEPRDQYTILRLHGEFDTPFCDPFMKEVDELVDAGVGRVVLDMHMVKFINSTALGAVLRASKRLQRIEGRLTISRPSPFSRDVMEKVGMERAVPIFDSDEAAGEAELEA